MEILQKKNTKPGQDPSQHIVIRPTVDEKRTKKTLVYQDAQLEEKDKAI